MLHLYQPSILEDESIIGYLQRFALLATYGEFRPLLRSVLPLTGVQVPWDLPSSLDSLSQNVDVLPNGRDLLLNHTIFRSVTAFLPTSKKDQIRRQMTEQKSSQGLYFALGLTHSLGSSTKASQKFCPSCVQESLVKNGHSYWSRNHQFPYISTCGKHGDVLMTGSECCAITKRTSNFSYLPYRACGCSQPFAKVSDKSADSLYMQRDREISKLLLDGLSANWPEMEPADVSLLYRYVANQRGFKRGKYVDSVGLSSAFERFYGEEFLVSYSSKCAAETGWIAEAFRGGIPKSAVRNALIIHFLFKDLNEFFQQWHKGDWKSTDVTSRRSAEKPVKKSHFEGDSVVRSNMRLVLLEWKAKSDNPTRTAVSKARATAVNWVRANDWDWYEENFPIVPRAKIAAAQSIVWAEHHQNAERLATEHVQRRYKEVMELKSMPVRISRPILARGLRRPLSQLPNTLEIVNGLIESKKEFNERKAVWLYLNPAPHLSPEEILQFAYEKTRVPKGRIRELLRVNEFMAN